MSRYTIKLEQLISTDQFGEISIIIQYDVKGPKVISIKGDDLSDEILDQTQPFFNMYNFCLFKGIPPIEISDFFLSTNKSTSANTLIKLVLNEVKSAPNNIQTIEAKDVFEIDLTALKTLS